MKRIVAAVAAALALTLAGASSAQASTYTGAKWTSPVLVSDKTGDTALEVTRAVDLWARAGARVKMTKTANAPITVSYTNTLRDGAAAVALLVFAGDKMVRCDVLVDHGMRTASRELRRKVIGHELGHCFGLDHVSYHSIMSSAKVTAPTNRDKLAIRALYRR